jgi:hypothetical protein
MLRRLFALLSVLSLVLCVATCALWVRSYRRFDAVGVYVGNKTASVVSSRGIIGLNVLRFHVSETYHHEPVSARMSVSQGETSLEVLDRISSEYEDRLGDGVNRGPENGRWGFSFNEEDEYYLGLWSRKPRGIRSPDYHRWWIGLPLWLLSTIAMVLPACWLLAQHRRRGKVAESLCAYCGYDLRASPERCPECGAETNKPAPDAGRV